MDQSDPPPRDPRLGLLPPRNPNPRHSPLALRQATQDPPKALFLKLPESRPPPPGVSVLVSACQSGKAWEDLHAGFSCFHHADWTPPAAGWVLTSVEAYMGRNADFARSR